MFSQYVATFFVVSLFYIVLFKLIRHYRSQHTTSANSLYIGVRICLILFGIAMLGTELSYVNNFNSDYYLIKIRLISIFISLSFYTIMFIFIICYCILCNKQHNFFRSILFTLQNCVDFFCTFAIIWIISSLYATLLYSLAYPVYVIILVTLHVTIFIVTIIIFASFVPGVKYFWNKITRVFLRFTLICCTSIGIVVLAAGISAIYVGIICAYGSTIVERIFPQDGLVQALLLMPSLFVFLGVWLLQRKVFSKCSNIII